MIIAEVRALRPDHYQSPSVPTHNRESCPFCEGKESETPPEISAVRPSGTPPDTPGWSIRTIPNKYAAVGDHGEFVLERDGLFEEAPAVGAHEVIIETPDHDARIERYSIPKLRALLSVYRERFIDLHRDPRFKYIQIFRNEGALAGASLEHPHSQIIAIPITPQWLEVELASARAHFDKSGSCLFCDLLTQERADGRRIVFENDLFVSFAPFASRFPYETWIFPKTHCHDFQLVSDEELDALARVMQRTLRALEKSLDRPPFNYIIHSAPSGMPEATESDSIAAHYHWHFEIIPRLTKIAGFEWGTGLYINTTLPEKAAAQMRDSLEKSPEPDELTDD